ncbi:MAG TPA: UvrD-helicase domain-containing protein [Actinocrinis sp.]|nr:UvrD-helicase domain-containing protein [Actinocrinis sp.]
MPYTDEQMEAITAPLEPGVIVAGAGSGKTTVMAARVVWLVGTGAVAPSEVLGLTFTNKAAAELRERVGAALESAGLLGGRSRDQDEDEWALESAPFDQGGDEEEDVGEPVISTYHAYADRLIKEHGLRLGVEPSARLLADAGRYTLAARVVRAATGPFEALRGSISTITRDLVDLDAELSEHVVTPERLRAFDRAFATAAEEFRDPVTGKSVRARSRRTNRLGQIYERYLEAATKSRERVELLELVEEYRRVKGARELVDFGDQMALGTRLAEQVPEVGRIERERYRVVLLDEYQDTSVAQRRMLSSLFSGPDPRSGRGHPVTAVGDPCQSIYGWRGASAANIDQFPAHFRRGSGGAAPTYPLTENRRSGGRLLAFANERSVVLRQHHTSVRELSPSAEKADLGFATAALVRTYQDEVRWLADQIQQLAGVVPWSQVAVLVRKGSQIPEIYAELHGRGVPVEVVGLSGLLDLPEIADLVAMLDVIDDPIANASLVRLLAGPRWRIGPRDLALLGRRARDLVRPPDTDAEALDRAAANSDPTDVVSLSDALADPGDAVPFSAEARARFARFAAEIRRLRRSLTEPVVDVLHRILEETGLDVEIAASPAAYRQRCADTVGAFLSVAGNFADLDGEQSATAFRAFLRAAAEHERGLDIDLPPTAADTVKILTMHKAKGLEWEVVAVPHQYREAPKADKWTSKRSKLPHELRGDPMPRLEPERDKAAFEEFDAAMRDHAELEDRRLTYVTLTRAKSRLIASSHWWGPTQTRPREPNEMLVALREHCESGVEGGGGAEDDNANGEVLIWTPPPGDDERNPALGEGRETRWPLDPGHEARDRRREAATAVANRMRQLAAEAEAEVEAEAEAQAAAAASEAEAAEEAEAAAREGESVPAEGETAAAQAEGAAAHGETVGTEGAAAEPRVDGAESASEGVPVAGAVPDSEVAPEARGAQAFEAARDVVTAPVAGAEPVAGVAADADAAPEGRAVPDSGAAAVTGARSASGIVAATGAGLGSGAGAGSGGASASLDAPGSAQPPAPRRPVETFETAEERALVQGWDTDLEALLGELRRAREVRFDVTMPRTLSATRLVSYAADPEAFAEELFRPMPRPPAPQARRGTEFHAWVEHRYGQQSLFDEEDLELLADEDVDGTHDLAELKSAFLRSEYAEREPYRVEAPFQIRIAGQIVRGRIDAVYQDSDGTFEVVDWKTNRRQDADPLQLAIYRLAWAELACAPVERVRAAFLYVRTGAVHRYDDLPDRAALERILSGEPGTEPGAERGT